MNLYEETCLALKDNDLHWDDVIFIGSSDGEYTCTVKEYAKLADIEYDNGYGSPEVATDLIILFKDGTRLHRHEYDGAEHWEVTKPLKVANTTKPIKSLVGMGWSTLKDIEKELA